MAVADKVTDKRGMKRICTNCGIRFYDLNNRPITCPECDTEFTGKIKTKSRRGKVPAANEDAGQVQKVVAAKEKATDDDEDEADNAGEEMALSLDDDETPTSKDDDDDGLGSLDMGSNDDDDDDDLDDGGGNKSLEDELEEEGPDGAVTDEDAEDVT